MVSDSAGSRRPGKRVDAQRNRALVVEYAAAGATVTAIAAVSGLAERTVRGHLADPTVRTDLRALHDERLRAVTRRAVAAAEHAVVTLDDLIGATDVPAVVRVAAARALLATAVRLHETQIVADRLDEIERRLSDAEGR